MADGSPTARAPVALRIKVRFADVDAFVERFAPYVGRAGLFLRHKAPKPVGTEVRFELRLIDDRPVLVGMGVVRWARGPDVDRPQRPPGMAIEFTRVTKESREVILRVLELRRKLALRDGPRGLPDPPDDDAIPNTAASAAAIAADVASAAAPAPRRPRPRRHHPRRLPARPWPPPAPDDDAAEPADPPPPARRSTPTAAPATLEPHAPRRRAPPPAELIAAAGASTPTADAFDADQVADADIGGVLARARALAGDDADRELAALLEAAAAPIEISIEEASAGLASLLGTSPVPMRRSRGDDSVPIATRPGFATPPPVATPVAVTAAAGIAASFLDDGDGDGASDIDDGPTPISSTPVPAQAAPLPRPSRPSDVETTRVVNLDALAAATVAPEGPTRIVSLDSLAAATADRDPDENTRVFTLTPEAGVDDERTKVVRIAPPPGAGDSDGDTDGDGDALHFDRPERVPRDFEEPERDVDTNVRAAPLPAGRARPVTPAAPARPARRTSPPPPPPRRRRGDSPAVTTSARRPSERNITSSGSIDITDIVAELEAEAAPPVRRPTEDGVGEQLDVEALDAAGLLATGLDSYRPRRVPEGPFPDLASFADPPAAPHRPTARADSLDAALAALDELDLDGEGRDDADDADGEERTSYDRPSSSSGSSRVTPTPERPPLPDDDDDDGLEIEISLDDD